MSYLAVSRRTPALLSLIFFLLLPAIARAHTRSESFSAWTVTGDEVTVVVTSPALEATRIATAPGDGRALAQRFADYLSDKVSVSSGGPCRQEQPPAALAARDGFVRTEFHFQCPAAPRALRFDAMFDLAPSHVNFAHLTIDDHAGDDFLFTNERRGWSLPEPATGSNPRQAADWKSLLGQFVTLGVRHILTGYDHVAFLVSVMLAAVVARNILIAVSGFTLGHSLTLTLAVIGMARPNPQLIEALIGLTIATVAIEAVALRTASTRASANAAAAAIGLLAVITALLKPGLQMPITYLAMALFVWCYLNLIGRLTPRDGIPGGWLLATITMVFGMIHGFGFASSLLETGRVGAHLALPLFGFNAGVELGQLAAVAALYGAGLMLRQLFARIFPQLREPLAAAAVAAALSGLGVFWLVTRTFS